jgi:Domain of unknown function (DUF4397)
MRNAIGMTLTIALALLLGACGGGSDSNRAQIRFVNVSPGTDSVNFSFADATAASAIAYHSASAYQGVDAGSPEFKVKSTTTGATLVDQTVTIAKGTHYTFLIYGGGTAVSAASLVDDIEDASSGKFKMRLSHSATGAGSLDVYLLSSGTSVNDSTPAYSAIGYAANTGFSEYSSGSYNIVLAPTGTKEVIYDSGSQKLSEKTKLTLLIFATGSGKLVNAALLLDDGSATTNFADNLYSRFKFINAGTNLRTADVLLDGSVALANIPYGGVSSYATIGTGARNVKIEASSTPGAYLYDHAQTLSAGEDYSLVAYSVAGTSSANLFALKDNNLPPTSGKAKLRVVNASSDNTSYDAYIDYGKAVPGLAPATGSAYQELDGGTYVLSFAATGSTNQVVTLTGQALDAAHVYTVYVYGQTSAVAAVLVKDD